MLYTRWGAHVIRLVHGGEETSMGNRLSPRRRIVSRQGQHGKGNTKIKKHAVEVNKIHIMHLVVNVDINIYNKPNHHTVRSRFPPLDNPWLMLALLNSYISSGIRFIKQYCREFEGDGRVTRMGDGFSCLPLHSFSYGVHKQYCYMFHINAHSLQFGMYPWPLV